jgi:hypothetical protein
LLLFLQKKKILFSLGKTNDCQPPQSDREKRASLSRESTSSFSEEKEAKRLLFFWGLQIF